MKNYLLKLLLLPVLTLVFAIGCSQGGSPGDGPTDVSGNNTPSEPVQAVMKPGNYPQTITIDGTLRSYILHIPSGYDGSKALPLVFVLHGHGGTAAGMVKLTGMNDKADQENFFVAYLQGTLGSDGKPGWNTGLIPEMGITVDDVAFVRDVLKQWEGQFLVDSKGVYAAGFSNGAMMSYRLAAELPDILAGVAIVEGTIGISPDNGASFYTIPNAKGPIPLIMFHGKQDPNLPYDGGQGLVCFVRSVAEAVTFWTGADGCTGTPQTQTSTDGNTITEDYTTCTSGSEVELITMKNGLHQWPTPENPGEISGTDAIWDFFSRHSKAN